MRRRPGRGTSRGARVLGALGALLALRPAAAHADDDDRARAAFVRDQRDLMLTLAAWSAASVASGAILVSASDRDFPRYFGVQNLAWGAIDGAIATVALVQLARSGDGDRARPASYWEDARRTTRTVFWVNAALDVAYVTAGAILWGAGKTDALRGTGAGIVMQGGFLLGFDTTGALVIAPR